MPQFDTFIFSSALFYFILSFAIYLYYNFTLFLPRLSSVLKLRHKLLGKKKVNDQHKTTYPTTFLKFDTFLATQRTNE